MPGPIVAEEAAPGEVGDCGVAGELNIDLSRFDVNHSLGSEIGRGEDKSDFCL